MKFVVGAYAASPCESEWNPVLETEYFNKLKEISLCGGLEHPFTGVLHRDPAWFLRHIAPHWQIVLTCIPGVMDRLKKNPHFGLASEQKEGQQEALTFMRECLDAVKTINDFCHRKAVTAVQIHSAPSPAQEGVASSKESFLEALRTLCDWEWDGANLVVEHCDAFLHHQKPAKGFLSLEDELSALQSCRHTFPEVPLGIGINWARSAIEGRSPDVAQRHIQDACQSGLLRGLIFSGCTNEPSSPYGAWSDTHMPLACEGTPYSAPHGLLERKEVKKSLQACRYQDLDYLGIKIKPLPATLATGDRIGYIKAALQLLHEELQ
jgi:hypothetical protein